MHPAGNPHYYLDPNRAKKIIQGFADHLSKLKPQSKEHFEKRKSDFFAVLDAKIPKWQKRIKDASVKNIITYHRTLDYFLRRFDLKLLTLIEPKAGVPPTAKHVVGVIKTLKQNKSSCVLHESFFETNIAERIKRDTGVRIVKVAPEVNALPGTSTYIDLLEHLVTAIESCKMNAKGSSG